MVIKRTDPVHLRSFPFTGANIIDRRDVFKKISDIHLAAGLSICNQLIELRHMRPPLRHFLLQPGWHGNRWRPSAV